MVKRKIKILETKYLPNQHIITWKVKYLDDQKIVTLVYRANDLALALLNREQGITAREAMEVNEWALGREMFEQSTFGRAQTPNLKDMTEEEIDIVSSEMNEFPIFELLGGKNE